MVRIILLVLLVSLTVLAADQETIQTYSHADLVGKWSGKWDGIYAIEMEIIRNNENYEVIYRYEEIAGEPLREIKDRGVPVNENTIKVGPIYIAVDQFKNNKVTAIGLFPQNTRISELKPIK